MRRILGALLILGTLGVLVEGPLARRVARRALERAAGGAGLSISFQGPEGGALRGLRFHAIRVHGDGLEGSVDEVELHLRATTISRVRLLRPRLVMTEARKRGQEPFSPRKRFLTPFPGLEVRDAAVRAPDFEIEGLDVDGAPARSGHFEGRARAARAAAVVEGRRIEARAPRAGFRWNGLTLFLTGVTWEGAPAGRGSLALHLRRPAFELVADLPLEDGNASLTLDAGATIQARAFRFPGALAPFLPPALAALRGRLDGRARFPDGPLDLTLHDATHGATALGTVRLRGSVARSRLTIDEAHASLAGGRVMASGTVDLETGRGDLRFEGDLPDLAALAPFAPWLRGPVRVEGALRGAALDFTVRSDRVEPLPGLEAKLRARGTFEGGRVLLTEASLARGTTRLQVVGTIATGEPRAATLDLEAQGLIEELQPLLPRRFAGDARGALAGRGRLTVDPSGPRLEGSVRVEGIDAGRLRAGRGSATVAFADGRWRFDGIEAQADVDEVRVRVHGEAARETDGTLTARLSETTASLGDRISASLRDALLTVTPGGEATLAAPEGSALGGALRSTRLSWSPATGGIAELELEGADPAPALERAGWTWLRTRAAAARGSVRYEEGRWSARADVALEAPVLHGEPFDSFAGRVLVSGGRVELEGGELIGPPGRATGTGSFQNGAVLAQFGATADASRLAARLGLPGSWAGRLDGQLRAEGALEAPRWSGFVHWRDGAWTPPRGPAWTSATASAVLGDEALALQAGAESASGQAGARVEVRLEDAGRSRPWDRALWGMVTARVEGAGFDVSSLHPDVRGIASFRLSAQGVPGGPFERSLEGEVSLRAGAWRDFEEARLHAAIQRGRARAVASGRFLDGKWTAEADGDLEPTGAPFGWRLAPGGVGRATLTDVALARLPGMPSGATGRLEAEAHATSLHPLAGTLRARAPDARVPLPGLDAPAENLTLNATIRQGRTSLGGEAWIGRGRVEVEGLATRKEARIRAALEKVLLRDRPGLLARASGALFFIGDLDGGLVTGSVFPDPLEVTARFDPSVLPGPRDVEAGPALPGRGPEGFNLDVSIVGGQTLVENRELTARFRPDLRMVGTVGAPRLHGSVKVEPGGEFRFPTARLELAEATLSFEDGDPARPLLSALATTRMGGVDLYVRARGRADEPDLDVSSHPPLPREDAIALLATGFTRSELAASGGMRDAAAYQGLRALLDEATERTTSPERGLGGVFERVEAERVRPLDVGTRPGDTPGAPPTATGESPGRLIYRLTDTLGLSAERDAYGDLNFNLVLRLRFP